MGATIQSTFRGFRDCGRANRAVLVLSSIGVGSVFFSW